MKDIITQYTKQITKTEGFNVDIKFLRLYCSGKKIIEGNCSKEKQRINFNIIFSVPYKFIKKMSSRPDIWGTMLHEVCHLKDEDNFQSYSFSDLKKNEYIDGQHSLAFWKNLRVMRRKYAKLKNKFYKELENVKE